VSLQQIVGVSSSVWQNMTPPERIALMTKARDVKQASMLKSLNRMVLSGKPTEKLQAALNVLGSKTYEAAAVNAAQTGRF
jgi:hypothetical protein